MEFLVIGNITKDLIRTKDREEYSFGGASYPGITAKQLGYKTRVLSRGNDQLSEWIEQLNIMGIEVLLQPDENVTYFVNDYTSGERKQLLYAHTKKIDFKIDEKIDIIHVSPVFQEVDSELIKKAKKQCDFLSLDVQGLVRDVKDLHVIGRFWEDKEEYLPL